MQPLTLANANPSPPPPLRRTYTTINLAALQQNCVAVRRHCGPLRTLAAVVKADAYGHGLLPVAEHLCRTRAVDALVVVRVEDAIDLRQTGAVPMDANMPILVVAGSLEGEYENVVEYALTAVVGRCEDIVGLDRAAERARRTVEVHIEVDVGMARLGCALSELPALVEAAQRADNVTVVAIMAHPSHAEEQDGCLHGRQYAFVKCAAQMLGKDGGGDANTCSWHVANSASVARWSSSCQSEAATAGQGTEMVRIGLALYGVQPCGFRTIPSLEPILSWYATIVAVRTLKPGQTVGYDGTWEATRQTRVATMCVGYADGYPRGLSSKGHVLVRSRRAKIVGRMDYTMLDVSHITPAVCVGDRVTLIGNELEAPTANEVAQMADTIAWEILSRISSRVPRFYEMS